MVTLRDLFSWYVIYVYSYIKETELSLHLFSLCVRRMGTLNPRSRVQ
jgi:hypothetical protein